LVRQPEYVPTLPGTVEAGTAGPPPSGGQRRSRWKALGSGSMVRLGLGVVASAVCLFLLASESRLAAIQDSMRRMDFGLLGLGMLLTLSIMVCKAARWRTLYPADKRPPLRLAIAGIAMGQVANWAVPARLGELIRIGLVSMDGEEGDARGHASIAMSAGVLGAEKFFEGLMLLLTVALLLSIVGIPLWISPIGLLSTAVFCVFGVVAVVAWRLELVRITLPSWLAAPIQRRFGAASLTAHIHSFGEGLMSWCSPYGIAVAVFWSIGGWALGGLINVVVLKSLGSGLGPMGDIGSSLALLAGLYGAAVIPSVPGRVGVFQYVCVLVLGTFGVGVDNAVAFALALYAVVYVPPLVVGVLSVALVWPETQRALSGIRPLQARMARVVRGQPRSAEAVPPLTERG
jgi:glycosyltransferase 2 family protein